MEALTGVTVALLTVWDMVKSAEKDPDGQYPVTRIEGSGWWRRGRAGHVLLKDPDNLHDDEIKDTLFCDYWRGCSRGASAPAAWAPPAVDPEWSSIGNWPGHENYPLVVG